jgi:hypothetical protein
MTAFTSSPIVRFQALSQGSFISYRQPLNSHNRPRQSFRPYHRALLFLTHRLRGQYGADKGKFQALSQGSFISYKGIVDGYNCAVEDVSGPRAHPVKGIVGLLYFLLSLSPSTLSPITCFRPSRSTLSRVSQGSLISYSDSNELAPIAAAGFRPYHRALLFLTGVEWTTAAWQAGEEVSGPRVAPCKGYHRALLFLTH